MSIGRPSLPAVSLLLPLLLAPASAAALVIAQNDSLDASTLAEPTSVPICPCFCNFECFGSTFTAPDELSANYVYLLYGASLPINTAVDIAILQDPNAFSPGAPFEDALGEESVLTYFPMQTGSTQLYEINVVASEVTPPVIGEGVDFSVTVCFNYDAEDSLDDIRPDTGHGPVYDSDGADGGNWIRALVAGECGDISATYQWMDANDPLGGDWVIRVTDEPVDWLAGGDDDDAADDDDASDDDDDTAVDDDDAELVVLSVSPNFGYAGQSTDIAITGEGFDESVQVFIGGLAASGVSFVSQSRVDASTPQALTASDLPYDLVVNGSDGRSSTLPGAFEVREPAGGCSNCQDSLAARGAPAPAPFLVLFVTAGFYFGIRRST
jgi:hypothetical protein